MMKNAWAFLAAASSLFLGSTPGRSQDTGIRPSPAIPGISAGTFDTTPAYPAAKCLTLQQRLEEWAKLRPASQLEMAPAEPPAPSEALLPMPAVSAAAPLAPAGVPCLAGPRRRGCWEQLDDWLTYRPLHRCPCDCFPKCAPCFPPPLYTFFIGACCVNPAGAGCRGPCTRTCDTCASGYRCAGLWDGLRNCRLWPSLGDFHLWHRSSDFPSCHARSCAQGTCIADDANTEK